MPLYSEEVQDIMGRIPGRILRIGLTVIFGILLMLLGGSYFFRSPEVIACPVKLTTVNPPQELYARSSGMIERLVVAEHEQVLPGQLIAVIRNTADYEDAQKLGQFLGNMEGMARWDSLVSGQELMGEWKVGEMQAGYIRLCKSWNNFRHYLKQDYLPMKIRLQKQQIAKQEKDYGELCRQQALQKLDFELTEKQFRRDSSFYCRYQDAVSAVEYEKQTQSYLQKKSSYMNFCTSVRNAENEILKQNNQLVDLKIQYEKELNAYRQELDEAYQLLAESYQQWKEKYVLVSQVEGIVTLTGYWSEKQVVTAGERVATIVPQKEMQIIGRAVVNMNGVGKVKEGQPVNIKLSGFPYMEFGMIKGKVKHISLVPEKEQGYIAEIALTEGMYSSYKGQLKFIQEIEGTAEIITQDERLLTRLISPLRVNINE